MSDLRSYITRVLNVLAEIDDLNADKKAIYKEIAADGFDRTVVSQVVGHIRKKAAKPGKFAEQSQLFDLYLTEYEGVGTPVATHAACEATPEHDAETGEIIEPQPLAAQTVPAQPVAKSPAEGDAVETSAPIQPETANEDPSDEKRRPDATDGQTGTDQQTATSAGRIIAGVDQKRSVTAGETAPHSEPVEGAPAGKSAEASASAAPSNVHQLRKKQPAFEDDPHPECRKPEFCGGFSMLGLCQDCRAHGEAVA